MIDLADVQPVPPRGREWGGWLLDESNYTLALGHWENYWVDLEDCTNSAQLADWIFQVAGKSWATSEVLAGLVRALDDVLHPQATLCSNGVGKRLRKQEIKDRVAGFARAHPGLLVPPVSAIKVGDRVLRASRK